MANKRIKDLESAQIANVQAGYMVVDTEEKTVKIPVSEVGQSANIPSVVSKTRSQQKGIKSGQNDDGRLVPEGFFENANNGKVLGITRESSGEMAMEVKTIATVATSGSYTDLSDKPTIPTKTSDITNDSGFVVGTAITTIVTSTEEPAEGTPTTTMTIVYEA